MKPDYKNWVPKGMIYSAAAGAAVTATACVASAIVGKGETGKIITGVTSVATVGLLGGAVYLKKLHDAFSYDGERKLSKDIIEGVASYVTLPEGGIGLDVGCGSGALTIACAKNNPHGKMIGIDRWGKEYASYNKTLCESNAKAEGVKNVSFQSGNALKLDFPDETFDVVTSNYVYHNVVGTNKQDCLRETLRVLKKGGCFALHDMMTPLRYGNMQKFIEELKFEGYEKVEFINTGKGLFVDEKEARWMDLSGSMLLVGIK